MASFVDVVDLRGQVVVDMLSSDWKDYEDDLNEYYREVVRRYYTLGSHPVRNKQWNRLKLLRYICVDNRIVYEDVTPQIR